MELPYAVELLGTWAFIFVEDFLRYFLVAGLLAYLLYKFSDWADSHRIQKSRATAADRRREQRHSTLTILIFSLNGLGIFALSELGVLDLSADFTLLTLLVELVLIIVFHDAYFYWMHRGLHASRRLMRVHALHHRSRTPSPWAAYSFSAGEAILEAVFLPIYALLIPMHGITAFIFTSHMIIRNVLGHAGVEMYPKWWATHPLTRWITSTTHHDLHHSEFKYNFGLYFTWWDRWMDTEHPQYLQRFAQAHRAAKPDVRTSASASSALLALVICFGALLPASPAVASDAVTGCWENSTHSIRVGFSACGRAMCGVLKSVDTAMNGSGEVLTDTRNQRRRLRKRPLLGLKLAQLTKTRSNSIWSGTLYRPDTGVLQKARFKVLENGSLKIRACTGHRCESLYWHRTDAALCATS